MKKIYNKALSVFLAVLLCFSIVPMSAFADELESSNPQSQFETENTENELSDSEISDTESNIETDIESGAESSTVVEDGNEPESEVSSEPESEPEPSPTPDVPLYISNISLAIANGSEKAKKHLTDRGLEVFDQDLNAGTGRDHVYLGYSTTTNPDRALTDIRVRELTEEEISAGEGSFVNINGMSYVGAIMILDEKSKLSSSTFGGGFVMASTTTREQYSEAKEITVMVSEAVLDLATFGLWSIGNMIYDAAWKYSSFLCVYATRDKNAGTPILADFLFDRNNRVAPPEYEAVAHFGSDTAADLNNEVENDAYKRNFLFYKTGIDYSQSNNPDYVSDIRMYRFINNKVIPQRTMSEAMTITEQLCTDANIPHWELEGYTAVETDIYKGKEYYTLYLTYKTSKNPYRAITDIKYVNTSDSDNISNYAGYRDTATYISTHNVITSYYPNRASMDPDNISDGYSYMKKHNYKRTYTASADLGRSLLYTTTSQNAGDPIKPEFLLYDTSVNLSDEWSPVTEFLSYEPADLTKGSGSSIDYFMYFKRQQIPPSEPGKYYSNIDLIIEKTYARAVFKVLEKGYDGLLDLGINHNISKSGYSIPSPAGNAFLIYKKTDTKSGAITGLVTTHNKSTLVSERSDRRVLKYDTSIKLNNIDYTAIGRVSPYHITAPQGTSTLKKDVSLGDDIILYCTSSVRAGKPLTDINVGTVPMMNGYNNPVYNSDGSISDLTKGSGASDDKYLLYNREGEVTDAQYISEVAVVSAATKIKKEGDIAGRSGAILELIKIGIKGMVDMDFNRDTGKDFIYLGYNKTDNRDEAITGLIATYDKPWIESIEHEGITYTSVSKVDFNKSTGGNDIFLYYTKDKKAGDPITSIEASDFRLLNGFSHIVNYTDNTPADFTKSSKTEKDIFILFNRESDIQCEYISVLNLKNGSEKKGALSLLFDSGIKSYVDCDFNQGTGKDYIYLGYNKTNNISEAITGLIATYDKPWQENISYGGITYTAVSDLDINKGTGGKDIFLYYTKDSRAGEPISEIKTNYMPTCNSTEEIVYSTDGLELDFTKSSGAEKDIYVIYSRATSDISAVSSIASVFAPPSLWFILAFASVLLIGASVFAVAHHRKKKKT